MQLAEVFVSVDYYMSMYTNMHELFVWIQDEGNASQLFQYGPEPGDVDFRKALADFLTQEYMDPVEV